jgi:hypothetical protein
LAARQQQAAELRQRNLRELEKKQTKTSAGASVCAGTVHPRLTSTREVAARVTKYETDAKWLAQCAASVERRRELASRHDQDVKSRWRSANGNDGDGDHDRHLDRDDSASTHASGAQQSTAVASENSVVRRVREQQAEGRERRQRLAEQHRLEEERRWLRANAHRSGDDYAPPAASSLLAWSSVNEAAAELLRPQHPRRCR